MSASMAPVRVMHIRTVIPKHEILCILFNLVSMILYELLGLGILCCLSDSFIETVPSTSGM